MNKKMIARELVMMAKNLVADEADYKYDPDHKHKPQGGGWEKTEKGWSKKEKKELTQEKDKDRPSSLDFSKLNVYKRQKIAESDETKPEVLEKLSNDRSENVRRGVAWNKNSPSKILEKLSNDESEVVREYVANNKNTPVKTLEKLSNDESDFVRDTAKGSLNKRKKESTIDLNKLSPELRKEVEDMDPEELGKFIGWLKKRKGMGGGTGEKVEV